MDAVCTHVTSSAASRDCAVKLTTDSYQFWVAQLKPVSYFSTAYTVCKKSAIYGDASSIHRGTTDTVSHFRYAPLFQGPHCLQEC